MTYIFLEGMILQASLIFALGPQNLFVLESGLVRHHHILVSLVCFICDFSLIMMGVIGAAPFINTYPEIKILIGILGVGSLVNYGIQKIRLNKFNLIIDQNEIRNSLKVTITSSLVFSLVNPHAYLDGIVLIGGYSSKYLDLKNRLTLGLGAASFSLIWFLLLSIGASFMLPVFKSGKNMRYLMAGSGVLLLFLSFRLGVDVYSWVKEIYPGTFELSASK